MSKSFRCRECGSRNHILEALNESLLAIASGLAAEVVLQRIVDAARRLVHASFAAVGVADRGEHFSLLTTSVGDDGQPLPEETERLLASVVIETSPYMTNDIQKDPRFGGWPVGYPQLKSFLGVPIVSGEETVGAFFLSNENSWGFSSEDKEVVEVLAPHAGLALKNVRLYEQSRELSVMQERNRLARELHDSVTQTLFSMKLAAETAAALIEADPGEARAQLARLQTLAREASTEMRSLIFELRPPELEIEGLVTTLRKHIEVLRRVHRIQIELHHRGDRELDPVEEKEIFRIVQEAIHNAIRHAGATTISVDLVTEQDKLHVSVSDDGRGFDTASSKASRRFGLISMKERAQALGGELVISSSPGQGTVVSFEGHR